MTIDDTATSKFLSYVLRHRPDSIGLELDSAGWVAIDDLIRACARAGRDVSDSDVTRIVKGDTKQRYEMCDGRIRAAQGHSIGVELALEEVVPPRWLYHGTVERFLDGIRSEGLKSGARDHVHLSADAATATVVGARRGTAIVLRIDAQGCHRSGQSFYRASNGVWLTSHVAQEFVELPESGRSQGERSTEDR